MGHLETASPYGPSARLYDRLWGGRVCELAMPVLEALLLRRLPPRAAVLDVCCGSGRISQAVAERGFAVTGLDLDADMLACARANAPACRLLRADMREFTLAPVFAGALSTSDSFNHLATLPEVEQALANVRRALAAGGLFCFDVLLAGEFAASDQPTRAHVDDDFVQLWRETFEAATGRLGAQGTLFYRHGGWRRWDVTAFEQLYTAADVEGALVAAGFTGIRMLSAERDLGCPDLAGRTYVVAETEPRSHGIGTRAAADRGGAAKAPPGPGALPGSAAPEAPLTPPALPGLAAPEAPASLVPPPASPASPASPAPTAPVVPIAAAVPVAGPAAAPAVPVRGYGAAALAEAYDRLIGPRLAAQVMPVCERLLFPGLPAGAAILELGCGTGHLAQFLLARGYRVTGLDLAVEMLAHAAGNAPRGRFVAADLRRFVLPAVHDAGLMIGTLGYLASAGELATVFANAHRALRPGASLLLEVFLPGDYGAERLFAHVDEDLAVALRESYAASGRSSSTAVTIFRRRGDWQRWDGGWQETYHSAADIRAALVAAGFAAPRFHDGRDLGRPDLAERTFVVATRDP